jgi:hypothetical protein
MRARDSIAVVMLFGAVAAATEPPRRNVPTQDVSTRKPATAVTPPGATSPAPLKLTVGNVRKYMMPNEFMAAVNSPDADKYTVVVEGSREAAPLQSTQPVPGGIIAPFWAIAHPANAWRVFLPDPNAPPPGRPDVVPKPEFRWGP